MFFLSTEQELAEVPNHPAVFLLRLKGAPPYLARTRVLQRRLGRLFRMEKLRDSIELVQYWPVGSALEREMVFYEQARTHFPDRYLQLIHLRMPSYVRLLLHHEFPRTQVTSSFSRQGGLYFGPFQTRASAEHFESEFLDLFQMRRCQEELAPSPLHPGCVYGEMGMCLRPCQGAVSAQEYRQEVRRAAEFLATEGLSSWESAIAQRNQFSEEMNFEEAARLHKRVEKIEEVRKLQDEFAGDLDRLNAIAVMPSVEAQAVELAFIRNGHWQPQIHRMMLDLSTGKPAAPETKLKEAGFPGGKYGATSA